MPVIVQHYKSQFCFINLILDAIILYNCQNYQTAHELMTDLVRRQCCERVKIYYRKMK